MKIKFLFCLIVLSQLAFGSTKYKNWKLKNDFQTTKVFQNNQENSLYASIEQSKISSEKEYKDYLKDISKIQDEKKKTLSLIGVSDWKASKSKWIKIGKRSFFEVNGTYVDNSDDTVYFKEYHLVQDKSVVKVLFTTTQNKALKNNDINNFLDKVKLGEVNE